MEINIVISLIREFDMTRAGLSVLRELGHISEEMYLDLKDGSKIDGNISIGQLMRDVSKELELSKIVNDNIKKYVDMFIEANKIKPNQILEIAKDAIFLNKANPKILDFGEYIQFRCKSRYYIMVEFPISETNHNTVKLYKEYAGLKCRGAKLNVEHPGYYILLRLVMAIKESDTLMYHQALKELIKCCKNNSDHIINSVENSHLIKVFKEISI